MATLDSCIATGEYRSIDELLNAYHYAAETSNLAQYFGCFHRDGRFLGTDASENWHVNEFYDFAKPHFQRSRCAWKFVPINGSRKVTYFPSSASPTFCIFDELLESESFLATSRGSGTLVFDTDRQVWLIASYHLSFPIPNDLAKEMTKKISIFEKVQKAKAAQAAASKK